MPHWVFLLALAVIAWLFLSVVGGFAILQADSKEEAVEYIKQFLKVAGDGECELRQVYEAGQNTCADAAAAS